MNRRHLLLVSSGVAIVALLYGLIRLSFGLGEWICQDGTWVKKGLPLVLRPSFPCLASGKSVSENNLPDIILIKPKSGDEIGHPLLASGKARVFENKFNFRLLDDQDTILTEGVANTSVIDIGEYGDFEIVAYYPVPKGEKGKFEVYNFSAKDGSLENLVSIPVKFSERVDAP